jgi:DNA-binding FadR family transcriptional regulator
MGVNEELLGERWPSCGVETPTKLRHRDACGVDSPLARRMRVRPVRYTRTLDNDASLNYASLGYSKNILQKVTPARPNKRLTRRAPRRLRDALHRSTVSAAERSMLSIVTGLPDRQPKLAAITADRIENEIAANGWQAGMLLGSQQTLMERHGVGRPVMREVLQLLALRGVLQTRRGSNGGVFVHASASSVVSSSLATCLRFTGLDMKGIALVRVVLEELAVRLAVERISPAARLRVRRIAAEVVIDRQDRIETLSRIQTIYVALAETTGNAALTTFMGAIYRAGIELSHFDLIESDAFANDMQLWLAYTRNLVEAVIVGDISFAMRRLADSLDNSVRSAKEGARLERDAARTTKRRSVAGRFNRNRASYLAHEIDREIRMRGWPVGQSLGSEAALIKRYGTSRAVLRQAVRILETHSVVNMKRGRGGGLFVTSPSASRAISVAISHLASAKTERLHVLELREALALQAVELVTERATEKDIAGLGGLVASMPARGSDGLAAKLAELHIRIAQLSGNSAIEIFTRVLLGLGVLQRPGGSAAGEFAQPLILGLVQLIDAIASGDVPLARRTLIIHLRDAAPHGD